MSESEGIKRAVLENLQKLAARIKELKGEAEKQKEKIVFLTNQHHQCWWDGGSCQRYSEICGFQDCGATCAQCSRLDIEKFWFVLERLNIDIGDDEDAWQEIHENILEIMDETGIESA